MATSEWEVGHGLTVSELAITVSCPRVGTVVCTLVGEVDLATESLLREQLQQAVMAGPRHLIVNLSDVSFLSVGGVGVLLETWRAQQDRCEMVLVGASHRVTLVLDVLEQGNLMPCLPRYDSVVQAMAGCNGDLEK
ncbi:MAG: STAS domain-containing protein [Pseudonocardiales bacterium]|nr:STAS domain-containing protein [Pseudonocardiales bacterium]MBV9650695.1 STAS domain-containing protein [Pseudonocardiales bacterium]